MTQYFGLDRGDTDVAAAEHWVRELVAGIDGVVACTHLVRVPTPHVAVSVVAAPRGALAVPAATGGGALVGARRTRRRGPAGARSCFRAWSGSSAG